MTTDRLIGKLVALQQVVLELPPEHVRILIDAEKVEEQKAVGELVQRISEHL
jgi:hypothetical protein